MKIYFRTFFLFSPLPGQIVIAYGDKLLSSYNTSQLLLSICKALNAKRYLFVDSSIIYLTGGSLHDHKLSDSLNRRRRGHCGKARHSCEGDIVPFINLKILRPYLTEDLLFCVLIHCLLLLLHYFVLETWELTQGLASLT